MRVGCWYKTPTSLVIGWKESLLFSVPPFRLDYVLPCRYLNSHKTTKQNRTAQGLKSRRSGWIRRSANLQVPRRVSPTWLSQLEVCFTPEIRNAVPCAWFLCFSILIAELRIQARNLTIKSLVLVDTFNQTVDAVSAVPQLWRMGLSGFWNGWKPET